MHRLTHAGARHDALELARRHLDAIAREPRPAGGDAETRARAYCVNELRALGFTVRERPFMYSAWTGRWATPAFGALSATVLAAAGALGIHGWPGTAEALLCVAAGILVTAGAGLTRRGTELRWLRASSINVEATRGGERPPVWLVAHLDSKSQPVPMALRVAGIVTSIVAWLAAGLVAELARRGVVSAATATSLWLPVTIAGVLGAVPVMLSTVGARSAGAVDNASGVATVLAAAALLPADASAGVLLTSAEELGLAGARAWAREWRASGAPAGVALNCDGVDDAGRLRLMRTGRSDIPAVAVRDAARAAALPLDERGLLPGILVDAVALGAIGWQCATLSRGTIGTLGRIHTGADTRDRLSGEGIAEAAVVLAGAAERLQQRAPAGAR